MHVRNRLVVATLPLLLVQLFTGGCASTEYSDASGSLTVQNDGAETIFRVRFSTKEDPSWGEDRLGSDVIASGARRSWTVTPGDYQVKIEYQDGRALDSLEVYSVPAYGEAVCRVTGAGSASSAMGSITVTNNSVTSPIYHVRWKTSSGDAWGDDRLGSAEVITQSGGTHRFPIAAGSYYVRVELGDGRSYDFPNVFQVTAGGDCACSITDVPASSSANGSITVVNACTTAAIHRIRYKLASDASWGDDRLGATETISQGGGRRTFSVPPGAYNLRAEFGDGRSVDANQVAQVSAGGESTWTLSDAAPSMGRLLVVNGSGQSVYRVRFKPTTASEWGIDQLGSDTIADGARRSWDVAPGTYHVKIEFQDGQVLDSLEEYVVPAGGEAKCEVWRR
jgi:hypothetical protein